MLGVLEPSVHWRRTRVIVAALVLLVAAGATVWTSPTARAATAWSISGTSTATSAMSPSIEIGDRFHWAVTFDLDQPSTGSTPSYGNTFNDSITAFTLTADPANQGTWDPTGAVWPITPAFNVAANANSDQFTVQVAPSGAPALNGSAVFDAVVSVGWSSVDLDAVWVAGTTDLRTWLGTTQPDMTNAWASFELRDANLTSASYSSTFGNAPSSSVVLPPPPPPPVPASSSDTATTVPTTTPATAEEGTGLPGTPTTGAVLAPTAPVEPIAEQAVTVVPAASLPATGRVSDTMTSLALAAFLAGVLLVLRSRRRAI